MIKISYKKHVTRQNHFVIAKLKKPEDPKRIRIISFTEALTFATVNTCL